MDSITYHHGHASTLNGAEICESEPIGTVAIGPRLCITGEMCLFLIKFDLLYRGGLTKGDTLVALYCLFKPFIGPAFRIHEPSTRPASTRPLIYAFISFVARFFTVARSSWSLRPNDIELCCGRRNLGTALGGVDQTVHLGISSNAYDYYFNITLPGPS